MCCVWLMSSHTANEALDALFFERQSLLTHQKLQKILSSESLLTSQDCYTQAQALSFLNGTLSPPILFCFVLDNAFSLSLSLSLSLSHTHTHTHTQQYADVEEGGQKEQRVMRQHYTWREFREEVLSQHEDLVCLLANQLRENSCRKFTFT